MRMEVRIDWGGFLEREWIYYFFIKNSFLFISFFFFFLLGICLDILQNRWSPTYDVSAILTSIQSLLDEPNPNSPANSVAAQLYQENRREYEKRVAAIVESSWLNYPPDDDDGSGPSSGSANDNSSSNNSAETWVIVLVWDTRGSSVCVKW